MFECFLKGSVKGNDIALASESGSCSDWHLVPGGVWVIPAWPGSENSEMLYIRIENQLSDPTAWVGKLRDAVNYN